MFERGVTQYSAVSTLSYHSLKYYEILNSRFALEHRYGALVTDITCKSVAERNVKRIVEEEIRVVWALKQVSDRGEPIKKLTYS